MIAIVCGLSAAALWAVGNLASARSARLIGPISTLAWVCFLGLLLNLPIALLSGPAPTLSPDVLPFYLLSGGSNVLGLAFFYRALRIGKIGVVSALTSTEGAIAAVIALLTGETISVIVGALLAVIATSVAWVAYFSGEDDGGTSSRRPVDPAVATRAAGYAILAAAVFGTGLYGTARISAELPLPYAASAARVVGTLALFVPLLLTRRLELSRTALPLVAFTGMAELVGTAAYALGTRDSIAIASVLVSQFGAISAVFAFLIYRERLTVRQRAGVVAIALAVAGLAAVRA